MDKPPIRLLLLPPIVSASLLGLGFGLTAFGIALREGDPFSFRIAMIWTGIGIVLGFLWGSIVWVSMLVSVYDKPTTKYEQTPAYVTIQLNEVQGEGLRVRYLDFPAGITLEKLVQVGKLLERNGFRFSHALAGSGRPLTRKEYEPLRDLLLAKGLLEWVSDLSAQQGVRLTAPGKKLFSQLATHQGGKPPRLLQSLS